jgi:hypothetical protein
LRQCPTRGAKRPCGPVLGETKLPNPAARRVRRRIGNVAAWVGRQDQRGCINIAGHRITLSLERGDLGSRAPVDDPNLIERVEVT